MKRVVLSLVVLSCVTVGVGYAAALLPGGAPAWAAWCLALGTNGALMSLMALGALRRDRLAPALRWTFLAMFVWCSGAFAAALLLPASEGPAAQLFLGLPLRAAIVVYAVGVAPLLVLPFVWALTFERETLSDDDLRRLRAAHEAMIAGSAPGAAETARTNAGGA